MACGKPLVLYNIEPHEEIISVSKAGEIFSSLESAEIISKIKNVYNNRKELGLNGRKFAKQNNWSEVCKKLIGIYEDKVD
jgi:glycosyltransferase involved in cell wall biosynthesis